MKLPPSLLRLLLSLALLTAPSAFAAATQTNSISVPALPNRPTPNLGLLQNLDGDLSFTGATPEQSLSKLRKLIDELHQGPVKTLMHSIGAGSDILYYQTKIASTWGWRKTKYDSQAAWKTRIEQCRLATEAGLDAPRIAGTRAKELGMLFFPSYRMNDSHYCSDPASKGKRHGNGSHPPPTEAYFQLPLTNLPAVRPSWNNIEVTLNAAPAASLELVEAEIGVIAPK